MKHFFLIAIAMVMTQAYAQTGVTKVTEKGEDYFITTKANTNFIGLYKYEGKKEPIVQLNADGTGLFQLHGTPSKEMIWGIESDAKGVAKELKVVWGSVYRLWYQVDGVWDIVQFSDHTDERILYILGERTKKY